jgi:hypothetical protein
MKRGMPQIRLTPTMAVISGGVDLAVPPLFAKPGSAVLAYNYEYDTSGGVERVYGIEPFDGRPAPSSAAYTYVLATADITGIVVGDTLTGLTSSATGKVIYISGAYLAMTRVTGTFAVEELQIGGLTKATVSALNPGVDGFLDNTLSKAAADEYQASIGAVPGDGRIRGIAILNDVVYAWRNNVGQTALAIYKQTAGGWVLVPLYEQISFTAGTTAYTEGSTLTQGGASSTVKRVVLESGSWTAGTAAGRLIISARTGGNYSAGAAAGSVGACTLSGAQAQITQAPGGMVSHDAYNFTAAIATKRLYGCDGINPEWEFDGDVLVPLNTGMGSIRATVAKCHKNYLFLAYRSSVQHCGPGTPYVWSAVLGAGELGTGGLITNMLSLGGASDASSLMVMGQDSIHVLYGDSTLNWNMVPLSRVQGAQRGTAQDIGGAVALDTPGVVRYSASQDYGNFAWDVVSQKIEPIARQQKANCSVFATGRFKYRVFLEDGTVLSGLPTGDKGFDWSVLNYGIVVTCAEHAEIAGVPRTFYGAEDGIVYEADKGRSFAGGPIQYGLKLHPMNQGNPMIEKAYRHGLLEVIASSACSLSTSFEFLDEEGPSLTTVTPQYGAGLAYDIGNFDETYWDTAGRLTKTIPIDGVGSGLTMLVTGSSDSELSHKINSITILQTPRRITR